MILGTLAEGYDLHQIDKKRLQELLPDDETPAFRTIVRQVDGEKISAKDREKLDAVFAAFGKEQARFIRMLMTRKHRRRCDDYKSWRNELLHSGYKSEAGLQNRHWKLALQAAAGICQRYWRAAQVKARDQLIREAWFGKLSADERSYVFIMLSDTHEAFFDMLDGKLPALTVPVSRGSSERRELAAASKIGLCAAMRRKIWACCGRVPQHGEDRSIWFDVSCYSQKRLPDGDVEVRVMSLEKGERVPVVIKGSVLVGKIGRAHV